MRITGLMARRLLVNWRVPLAAAQRVLPPGVRPKSVRGVAVAGLCLVRLEQMRPAGLPAWTGPASENLAVRMGVECNATGAVLIFRRATSSPVNALLGAPLHYGRHPRGEFQVVEAPKATCITVRGALDGHIHHASVDESLAVHDSVFGGLVEAERFFRGGECGYSPGARRGVWDGLHLRLHRWDLHAVRVRSAFSTLIDQLFGGRAEVDSAFIMRNIEHTWTPVPAMAWGESPTFPAWDIAAAPALPPVSPALPAKTRRTPALRRLASSRRDPLAVGGKWLS